MKNVMVVNMGLKSIRCIIFNQNGLKLGSAAKAINTAINDKCVEQDPDEWWEKGILVVRKALSDAGCPQINYITVTTSASCLVCVDKYGNPLQNKKYAGIWTSIRKNKIGYGIKPYVA